MIDELKQAFRSFNDAAPKHRRLRISEESVALVSAKSERELWRVAWSNVEQIVAFKVDAITIDHICIGFRVGSDPTLHVADEETLGWQELLAELSQRFGVQSDAWFARVAFPAFAENFTVLWAAP